jgi:hypothetical protein
MTDPLDATPMSEGGGAGGGDNTMLFIGIGAIVLVFVAGVTVAMWNARR